METVLIVDDEPDLRFLLRAVFENEGLNCLEANNGHRALQILDDHGEVSLVVTDYRMPELNGLELLRCMRSHSMHRSIPVILITAEHSKDIRIQAAQAGAKQVLFKPYDFLDLKRCVNGVLGPYRPVNGFLPLNALNESSRVTFKSF